MTTLPSSPPDDPNLCPYCQQYGCTYMTTGADCPEALKMWEEMERDNPPPPKERGPFYCCICHERQVDALNGYDTCDECLSKQ